MIPVKLFSLYFSVPEMELTEADEIDVGIDPATGEVLQNPSPDQPPQYTTDILPNDNTTNDN